MNIHANAVIPLPFYVKAWSGSHIVLLLQPTTFFFFFINVNFQFPRLTIILCPINIIIVNIEALSHQSRA